MILHLNTQRFHPKMSFCNNGVRSFGSNTTELHFLPVSMLQVFTADFAGYCKQILQVTQNFQSLTDKGC